MKCTRLLSVFILSASIPHLLPNHPERKRVASEHRRLQPIKGISWGILHEPRQDLIISLGNPFRLQRPPPLLLQVPGRQKMPGGKPSNAHIFLSFSKLQPSPTQVTGLNGVNFLDRTRTPLEGPHPGLPPQVSSPSQFLSGSKHLLKTSSHQSLDNSTTINLYFLYSAGCLPRVKYLLDIC